MQVEPLDARNGVILAPTIGGAIVTLVCLVLAYPYAYWLTVVSPRTRALLLVVVLIPFWTSLMVRTFAWQILLRDQGVVNDLLDLDAAARLVGELPTAEEQKSVTDAASYACWRLEPKPGGLGRPPSPNH